MQDKDAVYEWDYLPSQRQGCRTFADLRITRHRWPVEAGADGCEPLPLIVGEDVSRPQRTRKRLTALSLHVRGLSRFYDVWLTVNGKRLTAWRPAALDLVGDRPADMWIEFQENLEIFKRGRNDLRIFVRPTSGSVPQRLTIDRAQLEVTYV